MTTPLYTWETIPNHPKWGEHELAYSQVGMDSLPYVHYVMGEIRDLRTMRNDPNIDLKIKAYIGGGILLLVVGVGLVTGISCWDVKWLAIGVPFSVVMWLGAAILLGIGIDKHCDLKKVRADTDGSFLKSLIDKSETKEKIRQHELKIRALKAASLLD